MKGASLRTAGHASLVAGAAALLLILFLLPDSIKGFVFAALAVAATLAGIVAIRRPLIGLVAIGILLAGDVSGNLISVFSSPSLAELAAAGLAAILVVRFVFMKKRPFFDPFAFGLFASFGLMIVLSASYARNYGIALETATDYLKDIVFVFLALAFFSERNALRLFNTSLVVTAFAICAIGLYVYATGDFSNNYMNFVRFTEPSLRFSGPLNDPNFFGAMLVFIIPLAVAKVVSARGFAMKAFGVVAFLVLTAALILTGSRGGMVALLAAFCVYLTTLDRRSQIFVSLVGIVALSVAVTVFSEEIMSRFELLFRPRDSASQMDLSTEGRLAGYEIALRLFLENPLLGVGAGNFNLFHQDYSLDLGLILRGEDRSAHSLYLEILSELGLVGFVIASAMFLAALGGAMRACRLLAAGGADRLYAEYAAFGVGLFGYLIAMTLLHDSYPRLLWTVTAIAIAMPRIARIELAARRGEQGPA